MEESLPVKLENIRMVNIMRPMSCISCVLTLLVAGALLLAVTVTSGQEKKQTKDSIVASPEVIKLEILTRLKESWEKPADLNKPYRVGDRIYFRVHVTNTSQAPVEIDIKDKYYQNRPLLLRDGQTVDYRDDIVKLLAAKEGEPSFLHAYGGPLEPGAEMDVDYINLANWYEPLEPGHYELSLRHRFGIRQQWIDSVNSVAFEVVPKTKAQEESELAEARRIVRGNPEVIRLHLTPIVRGHGAGMEKQIDPFEVGAEIKFSLRATNTLGIPLVVSADGDKYDQNRPKLLRDGQEVPYRKGLDELLENKDKEPAPEAIHLEVNHLEPAQQVELVTIDLSDWYESLEPGHYELSTRRRFVHGGKWVNSSSITFEVVTK